MTSADKEGCREFCPEGGLRIERDAKSVREKADRKQNQGEHRKSRSLWSAEVGEKVNVPERAWAERGCGKMRDQVEHRDGCEEMGFVCHPYGCSQRVCRQPQEF